jgi:hypothetical protein
MGSIIAALLTGLSGTLFFTGFIALPAYYFIHRILLWREGEVEHHWYPVLRALAELTVVAAASIMLLALATAEQGGLQSLIPQDYAAALKNADPDIAAMAQQLISNWSFMLFAAVGWLWIIMLYGFAVLANMLLKIKSYNLRHSLALEPNGLPIWILGLVILSGLLGAAGKGLDRFTGETIFILLLLPYLLSGIAFVHTFTLKRHFHFRILRLICFYIVLLCTRWPLLGVIAIGVYLQLAEILDRRNKIG